LEQQEGCKSKEEEDKALFECLSAQKVFRVSNGEATASGWENKFDLFEEGSELSAFSGLGPKEVEEEQSEGCHKKSLHRVCFSNLRTTAAALMGTTEAVARRTTTAVMFLARREGAT